MFTYILPESQIAHKAAEPRDSARLLHWPGLTETPFSSLPELLQPGDLLVLNSSKVIPARLYGTRAGREGGASVPVEILLHQSLESNLSRWSTFARPARRLKPGDTVVLEGGATATINAKTASGQVEITLNLPPEHIQTYLETHGHTPLPPYIHTEDSPEIRARYQTTYADSATPGSVAAPTAGLHFTPQLVEKLKQKKIETAKVTLHVGAGTFLNPTPEQIATRTLHAEFAHVSAETAAAVTACKARGGRVVAVGTTSLRTLESWALAGAPQGGWSASTTLFIQPGFRFQVVDKLITNFHLPGSSLLMLVEAFIGPEAIAQVYNHALTHGFRFYSFGDASLLTRASS